MCTAPKVKTPTVTPAPAPAVPAVDASQTAPTAPALNDEGASRTSDKQAGNARRKGTRGLRIDLQIGNAGAGGTGLNIPKA